MAELTYAFGVLLRLTTTAEGGRSTPLLGGGDPEHRFLYRPNWGLPGMTPPEQTSAPVLGFDREQVAPGATARAVIVALFPPQVPTWATIEPGEILPMYEGRRVCGHGRILWRRQTELPLPEPDEERFFRWLRDGTESRTPSVT